MYSTALIWFKRVESIVATIAYGIVATLLMLDVVGRELFSSSFLGTQQLAVYGAIIAAFLGLTLATSDNSHLRPEFMDFVFRRFDRIAGQMGDLVLLRQPSCPCLALLSATQRSHQLLH